MSPVKVTILKLYRDGEMCVYLFYFTVCCVVCFYSLYVVYVLYVYACIFYVSFIVFLAFIVPFTQVAHEKETHDSHRATLKIKNLKIQKE